MVSIHDVYKITQEQTEQIHDKWAKEKAEKTTKLKTDLRAVAALLGFEYDITDENCDWGGHLIGKDGHRLFFRADWRKKTYTVSGSYPLSDKRAKSARDWGAIAYNASEPSIGFTMTKTHGQMASDITKRLLPDYTAIYAKCLEAKASEEAYFAKKAGLIAELTAIGGEVMGHDKDKIHISTDTVYGEVTTSSDTAQFTLRSVSPSLARAIMRLIYEV